ncbi:unnamed protein product [Blepharisma stoltei]|uniref:RING-type domain-containing protein n=1 Tax=Blepharisma stoltei TaxID=1481888 RepID=A0AAU9KCV4_9CILI|nr:unnamed protein product [Blepharisma stoltei]
MEIRDSPDDHLSDYFLPSPISSPLISVFLPSIEFMNLPCKRPKPSETHGYDPSRFESQVPEDFLCGFCEKVVREPSECINCGTLFCNFCVKEKRGAFPCSDISNDSVQCPKCSNKIDFRKLSRVLCTMINEMKIYCKNSKRGCDVISTLGDIKNHEETCKFKNVKCGNHKYCNNKGKASDFILIEVKPVSYYSNVRRAPWQTKMYACCEMCKKMIKFEKTVMNKQYDKALASYFKTLKKIEKKNGEIAEE